MAEDTNIAFIRGLADRFMQFYALQMAQRREERYDKQLASNLRMDQRRLDLAERAEQRMGQSTQALTDYRTKSLGLQERGLAETERYHTGMMELGQGRIMATGMKHAREAGLKELELATGLRKEFLSSDAWKNYQVIERSEAGMRQALEMSLNPNADTRIASDQALAVLFQKMLDPTSVVRESEYARTPEGIAAISKIEAYLPKLIKGGVAITDKDRRSLYEVGQRLLHESKRTVNREVGQYETLSDLYGIDRNLVLGDIKQFGLGESNQVFPSQGRNGTPVFQPQSQPGRIDFMNEVKRIQQEQGRDAAEKYYNENAGQYDWGQP